MKYQRQESSVFRDLMLEPTYSHTRLNHYSVAPIKELRLRFCNGDLLILNEFELKAMNLIMTEEPLAENP